MGCVQCWLAGWRCVTSGDQVTLYLTPWHLTRAVAGVWAVYWYLLIPSMPPVSPRLISSARDLPLDSGQEIKPFGPQFPILRRVMPARVCFSDWWRDISIFVLNTGISSACLPAAYTPLLGDSDNSVCTVWVVRWCQWCGEAERRILIMKWGRQFSALHVFSFLICCFAPVLRSIQYSLCISSAQPTTTHHMWLAVYRAECAHIDNCSMH